MKKKMTNQNVTHRETQKIGLGAMIGRCSFDSQRKLLDGFLWMANGLFPWDKMNKLNNLLNQKYKQRKCSRDDNKLALFVIFGATQIKGTIKKLIEFFWIYKI